MKNKEYKRNLIILSLIAIVILFAFNERITTLGLDEAMYMTSSYEMVSNHNYISPTYNHKPFYDKPPLVYILEAGSYDLFHNIIPSKLFLFRLPVSLISLLFILSIVFFGNKIFGKKTGIYAGFIFLLCPLSVALGKMAIMDMVLSFFIFLSLMFFLLVYLKKKNKYFLIFSWISLSLGALTKGPVAIICVFLVIFTFLIIKKNLKFLLSLPNLFGIILFFLIVSPWFIEMQKLSGGTFFYEFFIHQNIQRAAGMDFGHNYPFYSYIIIIAIGFLPWSFYLIPSILKFKLNHNDHVPETFLSIWIISLFIFFSLLVGKLPGYIFPIFGAAALLMGKFFAEYKPSKGLKYYAMGSALLSCILGIAFSSVLFLLNHQTLYAKISAIMAGLFLIYFGIYALIKVFKKQNPYQSYKYQMIGFSLCIVLSLTLITNNPMNSADEISSGYDLGTGSYYISKEFNIRNLPYDVKVYAYDLHPWSVSYPLNFEREVCFLDKNEKVNLSDKYLIIGKDTLPLDIPGKRIENLPQFTGKKHKYIFIKNY